MTDKFTDCTEAEFDAFVRGYGKPLEANVSTMYEPPLFSLNDFTRGKWPDSVVAYCTLTKGYPNEPDRRDFKILRSIPHD